MIIPPEMMTIGKIMITNAISKEMLEFSINYTI